jgi:hypothetical protein
MLRAGMGGMDPSMMQRIMSNPRMAAAFQRAQENPRIMKAVQELAKDPRGTLKKYESDREISSVLQELQSLYRK